MLFYVFGNCMYTKFDNEPTYPTIFNLLFTIFSSYFAKCNKFFDFLQQGWKKPGFF